MTNLLINALIGIVVIAVVGWVAHELIGGQLAWVITVIVAALVLVVLLRGKPTL
jgi:uncharacterized membrane protein